MKEITGYTMDEINRRGWYQTVYPDPEVQAKAMERMSKMRHGDNLLTEEWEITRADGEKRTLSISTTIIQVEDGSVHVLAFMEDITERKQAEKEMRLLASIVKNIPDAICSMDINGNIISWNEGAEKMLGYKAEEISENHSLLFFRTHWPKRT